MRAPATVRLCLCGLLLGSPLPGGQGLAAQVPATQTATALRVQFLSGRAELLEGGAWRPIAGAAAVRQGLRTGRGRVRVSSTGPRGAGSLLLGSDSQIRTLRGEADLREGNFVLEGPVAVHVRGNHVVLDGPGRARVDLRGNVSRRLAVVSGSLRAAVGGRTVTLRAGQQLELKSLAVTAFREDDPWYAAQFTGVGEATVQATRGPVRLSGDGATTFAAVGERLDPGERLTTDAAAWAEVGFAGGGYLRLQAGSELSVTAAQRTARGQEVTLQVTRGSVWNVVPPGPLAGGVTTPGVGSVARGTVFGVDAGGRVRVSEGSPALVAAAAPAPGARPVTTRPFTLQLDPTPRAVRDLSLLARSLPDARVTLSVAGRRVPLTRQGEVFRLGALTPPLPEGTYALRVVAERAGQSRTSTRTVVVDRTPPSLSNLSAERSGSTLTLSGSVRDAGTARPTLTVRLGDETFTRQVSGAFTLLLPAPPPGTAARVLARDEAGNEAYADLP